MWSHFLSLPLKEAVYKLMVSRIEELWYCLFFLKKIEQQKKNQSTFNFHGDFVEKVAIAFSYPNFAYLYFCEFPLLQVPQKLEILSLKVQLQCSLLSYHLWNLPFLTTCSFPFLSHNQSGWWEGVLLRNWKMEARGWRDWVGGTVWLNQRV